MAESLFYCGNAVLIPKTTGKTAKNPGQLPPVLFFTPHAVNWLPTTPNSPSRNRLLCRLSIFADRYGTAATHTTGQKIIYSGGAAPQSSNRLPQNRNAKAPFFKSHYAGYNRPKVMKINHVAAVEAGRGSYRRRTPRPKPESIIFTGDGVNVFNPGAPPTTK